MMRRLICVLLVLVAVAGCGGQDGAAPGASEATTQTTTTTRPTTSATATTTTTTAVAAPALSVADVVTLAQTRLDDLWAANPGNASSGIIIECPEPGRTVEVGSVFDCTSRSRTPEAVETGRLVFLVLNESGVSAMLSGSDLPDLDAAYNTALHGLLCRDLAADRAGFPFDVAGTTPDTAAFLATAYWMLEGMPDRMDADGDGIPCETVFPDAAIEWVWDGGQLTGVSWQEGLELRGDGLGVVTFGEPRDDALVALTRYLGNPTLLLDDPVAFPEEAWYHGGPAATDQLAVWKDVGLAVAFSHYPFYRDDELVHFSGWSYTSSANANLTISTPEGVSVGDTLAEVSTAYGDRLVVSDDVCGPAFYLEPQVSAEVTDDARRYRIALEFGGPPSSDQSTLSALHAGLSPGC